MNQAAGRTLVFDRGTTRVARDLDRSVTAMPISISRGNVDGLVRGLALAVPVSALLWTATAGALMMAIR